MEILDIFSDNRTLNLELIEITGTPIIENEVRKVISMTSNAKAPEFDQIASGILKPLGEKVMSPRNFLMLHDERMLSDGL